MKEAILRFCRDEDGLAALEYALLAALIAVGIIGSVILLRTSLKTLFTYLSTELTSIQGGGG